LCAKQDAIGGAITVVEILGEELLDADLALSHNLFGKIGDAEASLSKGADDTITPLLKCSIGL
jgi:hypothetical protein